MQLVTMRALGTPLPTRELQATDRGGGGERGEKISRGKEGGLKGKEGREGIFVQDRVGGGGDKQGERKHIGERRTQGKEGREGIFVQDRVGEGGGGAFPPSRLPWDCPRVLYWIVSYTVRTVRMIPFPSPVLQDPLRTMLGT